MINDLYKRTNVLMAQFRFTGFERYNLFNSLCISQLVEMSKPYMEDLYIAWRKCVRHILCLPYRTHNALLPFLIQDLSIQLQLEKRLVKYFHDIQGSKKIFLRVGLCSRLILEGSTWSIGKSLTWLLHKHSWSRTILPNKVTMINAIDENSYIHGETGSLLR
jgi:hypothetical protein